MTEFEVREPETGVSVPSNGFSISPDLAADTFAKLSEVQDAVGRMVREAKVLGRRVPLGDGYAKEIGDFMAEYGIADTGSAVASLTAFGQEITELKQRIETALLRYGEQDTAAADGVDCVGGG